MSLIRPFAGLRPVPERAADVVAPPYDVLNTEEARRRAAGRPDHFVLKRIASRRHDPIAAHQAQDPFDGVFHCIAVGPQNLLCDGEVALLVANRAALNVLMDMFFLSGITVWTDDLETLERAPAYNSAGERLLHDRIVLGTVRVQ